MPAPARPACSRFFVSATIGRDLQRDDAVENRACSGDPAMIHYSRTEREASHDGQEDGEIIRRSHGIIGPNIQLPSLELAGRLDASRSSSRRRDIRPRRWPVAPVRRLLRTMRPASGSML